MNQVLTRLRDGLQEICAFVWNLLWIVIEPLLEKIAVPFLRFCGLSPRESVEFCLNMFVGFIAFNFIGLFAPNETGQTMINTKFDSFIERRMEWLSAKKTKPDSWNNKNIIFFDIDAEAVKSLGHPYFFPRGYVAALVQYAKDQGAQIVLVDLDFSENDQKRENLAEFSGENGDNMLVDVLDRIEKDSNSETKILIQKTSYIDRVAKKSFVQAALEEKFSKTSVGSFGFDRIFWVSPHFYASDADPYVRFWAPYVEVHNGGNKDEIVWTMPFMAAALYYQDKDAQDKEAQKKLKALEHDKDVQRKLKALEDAITRGEENLKFPWRSDEYFSPVQHSKEEALKNLEKEIEVQKQQRNRIAFEFVSDYSPSLGTSEGFATAPVFKQLYGRKLEDRKTTIHRQIYHWRTQKDKDKDKDIGKKKIYIPIPSPKDENKAKTIGYLCKTDVETGSTESEEDKDRITDIDCNGKIVIIGRSDEEGRDLIWTPVEQMPGMYVHGNSIATLLNSQKLPHVAERIWFMICNLIAVIVFSYITIKFTPFKSLILIYLGSRILNRLFYVYFWITNEFVYAGAAYFAVALFDTVNKSAVDWLEKQVDFS